MSQEFNTSNTEDSTPSGVQSTTFVTTIDPDKPPTPPPNEEKKDSTPDPDKPPKPSEGEDKPPTPGPNEPSKPPKDDDNDPNDPPPRPESTLAPWSTLFEEDPGPTSNPTLKPPKDDDDPNKPPNDDEKEPTPDPDKPPKPTGDEEDRPPTPGPDDPTPGPKGENDPNDPNYAGVMEEKSHSPEIHSEMLTYKQSLGVSSVVIIIALIIFALLQIKIHKECYKNFKKVQFSNIAGKTLFVLFIIAAIMFLINAIVFCYFILHFNTLIEPENESPYAISMIFSMVPYRIGKLCMSLFFIFRLHFVFREAALRINKFTLYSLIILSIVGTILGCISGIVGPLKLIHWKKESKGINPALLIGFISLGIAIFVDIIVMAYYNQRLRAIVIMQGEVSHRRSTVTRARANTASRTSRATSIATSIRSAIRKPTITAAPASTEVVELRPETMRQKSGTWTNQNSINMNEGLERRTSNLAVSSPITPITPTPQYNSTNTSTDEDGDGHTSFPMNMDMDMDMGDGDGEWEDVVEITETEVHVDKNLVRTITKSTLLSLIGIMTSFWLHIEMIVMAIKGESDGALVRALASIDGGINVICMYLVFAFARPYYDIGCKVCHVAMSKCCIVATKRAVVRAHSTTMTELSV